MNGPEIPLRTAAEAARRLGVTRHRVHQLIRGGQLPAQRFGTQYAIADDELEAFAALPRRSGKPAGGRHLAATSGVVHLEGEAAGVTLCGRHLAGLRTSAPVTCRQCLRAASEPV